MKRINSALLLVLSCMLLNSASAQEFQKGNSVIDLGFKLGVYNDQLNIHGTTYSHDDKAGSKISYIGYEYALLNWLGVGLQLRYDKYIDTTHYAKATNVPSYSSFNIPLFVNAHFIRKKHFGLSTLKLDYHDPDATLVSGGGSLFDLHIVPRFFFGRGHFGLSLPIAFTSFSYPHLNFQNNAGTNSSNWGDLKGSGMNIGLALNFKF